MRIRFLIPGSVLWLLATLALRAEGQWILSDRHWLRILLLFTVSFFAMFYLIRRACIGAHLPPGEWLAAGLSLVFPTLLLDAFSSAFFPVVFPNVAPENAGVFGGWMLVCCAGGLLGTVLPGKRLA